MGRVAETGPTPKSQTRSILCTQYLHFHGTFNRLYFSRLDGLAREFEVWIQLGFGAWDLGIDPALWGSGKLFELDYCFPAGIQQELSVVLEGNEAHAS